MAKKRTNSIAAYAQRRLGPMIDRLGPINNAIRAVDGIDKVELLWDLGDTLLRFDPEANDELLWLIGERSYITRDLLRYGLIIRRGWPDRSELRRTIPRLTSYSVFRDALPFLKGDRCEITEEAYQGIVARLNRGATRDTKHFLQDLKRKKIGRTHKKGQAVAKMSQIANDVRQGIRELLDLAAAEATRVASARDALGPDALLMLSQWCMATAEDAQVPASVVDPRTLPEPFASLGNSLLNVRRCNRDDRAGFLRAIGPMTLMEAADLLNAMRSEDRLEEWKLRRQMKLQV